MFAAPRAARKSAIELRALWFGLIGHLFYGLSLGSVLLLAALGLAITFGLMRVINMAHGELLMLGAYATYVVQQVFQTYLPDYVDWYLVVAIPVAFVVTAAVGMALERTILRFFYGRPLETLLATWGISLILIQTVRSDLRRAERDRGEPVVARRWRPALARLRSDLQPRRRDRRSARSWWRSSGSCCSGRRSACTCAR